MRFSLLCSGESALSFYICVFFYTGVSLKEKKEKKKKLGISSWWKNLIILKCCVAKVVTSIFEPPHDKTDKVAVHPVKTRISPGIHPVWLESLLSAWRKLGSLATHWVHSKDSDQTGQMPRLICLHWPHSHIVGFVMRWLKLPIFHA